MLKNRDLAFLADIGIPLVAIVDLYVCDFSFPKGKLRENCCESRHTNGRNSVIDSKISLNHHKRQ